MSNESFKYYAFISYSHMDKKIAKKLLKRLEHYHLPAALQKSNPDLPKKLSPIFIDDSDLVGVGALKTALQANLDRSKYIILICSPSSAKSEYVNDEIEYFISQGRAEHIIPLIVEGVPHSGDPSTECFPPALLGLPRENELLGIDLTKFGEHEAFIRVIATLLQLDIDDFAARDAKGRLIKASVFTSVLSALLVLLIMLTPPSYDETYAENVMDASIAAYVNAGGQYEALHYLTDSAINNPEKFEDEIKLYKDRTFFAEVKVTKNTFQNLSYMMKTGKVMPWSRKPMSQIECEELLQLADSRSEEYRYFADVLVFVMNDDYARKHYGKEYPVLLHELLEIDADIAAELYQVVCTPHLTGKYADNSTTAKGAEGLFSVVPRQNEHLTGENVKQARESLVRLRGSRSQCLGRLRACGAFEAYKSANGEPEKKTAVISGDVQTVRQPVSIDQKPESEDQYIVRVLNDLLGYIYHCEMMYTDILYVLDSFERFDRVKDWNTLLLARATLASAKNDIVRKKLPAPKMTPEDEQRFMQRGIDISFLGTLDAQFKAHQTELTTTCNMFTSNIMFHALYKYDWEICMRNVASKREWTNLLIQSLANTADWVLASLNNPKAAEKFNTLLEKHCPKTRSCQRKTPDTPENIEASNRELMDKMGSLVLEYSQILGAEKDRLNLTKDAVEKNDMEFFSQEVAVISNMPLVVPTPKWLTYSDVDIHYFWRDFVSDDFKLNSIPPRTKLEIAPDVCIIESQGITLEQVKAYQKTLTELTNLRVWDKTEDGKLTVFGANDNNFFAITLKNGLATIYMSIEPVCFVPTMSLPAVMSMIREERKQQPHF